MGLIRGACNWVVSGVVAFDGAMIGTRRFAVLHEVFASTFHCLLLLSV